MHEKEGNLLMSLLPIFNFHNHRLMFLLFLALLLSSLSPGATEAQEDVKKAMVKIYTVVKKPDFDAPWNMNRIESVTGSGCVIEGNRIITNAHVVSDHTFIQVRLSGHPDKYTARVVDVAHEVDLALLTVDNPDFFDNTPFVPLADLPEIQQEVMVMGFPLGGDTLSMTAGIVSRIEHQKYVHSGMKFLAIQLDAAINSGNSGGPVLTQHGLVGVVMQSLEYSENIGYVVPVPLVQHFLEDLQDGRYDGFPEDGVMLLSMENPGMKKKYGLDTDSHGALVYKVLRDSSAFGIIKPDDIILSIDGHEIANDMTVEFRANKRTSADYYTQLHQIGENISLEIIRNREKLLLELTLDKPYGSSWIVPAEIYDRKPTYYIYGGLVLSPLTLNYLKTFADKHWEEYAPDHFITLWRRRNRSVDNEEIVVLIKILPQAVNKGYEEYSDLQIVKVNDKKINSLRELIAIVEKDKGEYVTFQDLEGRKIVLEHKEAEASLNDILRIYDVPSDRSSDLK
jgi:S1-C subfamily serine protease